MNDPRYPHITVEFTGSDGNALAIIGKVRSALRRGGVPAEEVTQFQQQAMSGDYNNVLTTCMEWVDVE